jgi:DNA topoisomerase-2
LIIYEERISYQTDELNRQLIMINEKIRFIIYIMEEEIIVFKKSKDEIAEQLINKDFKKVNETYDYLLNMPIYSFSKEKLEKTNADKEELERKIELMKEITIENLWTSELNEFLDSYGKYTKRREKFIKSCVDRDKKRIGKKGEKKIAIKK